MPSPTKRVGGLPLGLALLHADLVAARSALKSERCGPQVPSRARAAAEVLACLEAYEAVLTAEGLPVPPAIRDELRLRRSLP
ncbi:MAG: hypothetical protein ACRDO1_17230 [Nocardioidaceae bacterium]|nr:hypothetical protein [Propionibacteriales bacterium]